VTWRVLTGRTSEPDFAALTSGDGAAVLDELTAWVDQGPPRSGRRLVGGVEVFQDPLACGYMVTYYVQEADQLVAVLRVRRTRPGPS